MATKFVYFTGEVEWAKVRTPDEKYHNYTVDLYMDDDSWTKFFDSGLQLTPKEKDGKRYVTFRRPEEKLIKGETVNFGPPEVLIHEDDNYNDFDGLIGNGSTVMVKVAVYDTMRGKGHRLETVAVEELVEYNPEGGSGKDPDMPF